MRHYKFQTVSTSQLPPGAADRVRIAGQPVELTRQATGYGQKRLFLCPSCGARRAKLILHDGGLCCRGCAPFDVNYYRRNLYDEGGHRLIEWNMMRVAGAAGLSIAFPFKYYNHTAELLEQTHKGQERLRAVLLRLQMLENMRFCAIMFGQKFTPARIRKYTDPAFMAQFELWQVEKYCIFTSAYTPEEARQHMADRPDWAKP